MKQIIKNLEVSLEDNITDEAFDFFINYEFSEEKDYVIDSFLYLAIDEVYSKNIGERSIDKVYINVKHALPPTMYPILSTLGGFVLACGKSLKDGCLYHWDHEQGVGEHKITKLCNSFEELKEILIED